ncbi:hypothetical protein [Azospirillum argentinense]
MAALQGFVGEQSLNGVFNDATDLVKPGTMRLTDRAYDGLDAFTQAESSIVDAVLSGVG